MNTLDNNYIKLVNTILTKGTKKKVRNGETLSIFGWQIIHDMSKGFPILTTKEVFFKSLTVELLWFLKGSSDIRDLWKFNCNIWNGDYEKNKWNSFNLGKIYGYQWRKWNGNYDQIVELFKLLNSDPDSRRLLVSAWNASDLNEQILPPCHYGFQIYTRELSIEERIKLNSFINESEIIKDLPNNINYIQRKLDENNIPKRTISLSWNQRSVDVPLGLPFNISSYGLLLEILAKLFNMIPEKLIGNLGDCHIYTNQIDGIKEQISRKPFKLPKLKIDFEDLKYENGDRIEIINEFDFLEKLNNEAFIKALLKNGISLENYIHHKKIYFPLSN